MAESTKRIMVLGATDGFRYFGFKPALSDDEVRALPRPSKGYGAFFSIMPPSVEYHEHDESMDIGYMVDGLEDDADRMFVEHAREVAKQLGNVDLRETVAIVGPGSVIGQVLLGARPEY